MLKGFHNKIESFWVFTIQSKVSTDLKTKIKSIEHFPKCRLVAGGDLEELDKGVEVQTASKNTKYSSLTKYAQERFKDNHADAKIQNGI